MNNANVKVLGESSDMVTVQGSRAEVRRYVFSRGLEMGAPRYFTESYSGGVAYYDTSRVTGHDLKSQSGDFAGLMLYAFDGVTTATMRKACLT